MSDGMVLQVISDTDGRGAQTFAVNLETALHRAGLHVDTLALTRGKYGGIDVPVLGRRSRGARTLLRLRRRADDAAILIAHGSTTLSASAIATIGLGIPFVYRVIGDPSFWAGEGWRRRWMGALLRRASRVVVLDDRAAHIVASRHHVSPERLAVVPNGVPAEEFPSVTAATRSAARSELRLPEAGPVVAYLGALGPEKNVGAAIDAIGRLPDVTLVVAGSGPERDRLVALAARRAPGRVRFLGTASSPALVLAAADAVVLPSWTEGMPAALIEAGLTGIPVVATDVGAVRAIVVPGQTGLVVPAGDAEQLAVGLRHALDHGPALGRAARARCLTNFTMDTVATGWRSVIESVGVTRPLMP